MATGSRWPCLWRGIGPGSVLLRSSHQPVFWPEFSFFHGKYQHSRALPNLYFCAEQTVFIHILYSVLSCSAGLCFASSIDRIHPCRDIWIQEWQINNVRQEPIFLFASKFVQFVTYFPLGRTDALFRHPFPRCIL